MVIEAFSDLLTCPGTTNGTKHTTQLAMVGRKLRATVSTCSTTNQLAHQMVLAVVATEKTSFTSGLVVTPEASVLALVATLEPPLVATLRTTFGTVPLVATTWVAAALIRTLIVKLPCRHSS